MGKVVEKRKMKKKGRPSLLDLQKRTIIEHHSPKPNPNPNHYPNSKITPTPHLRSFRRNPNHGPSSPPTGEDDKNEDDGLYSASLNYSGSYGADYEDDGTNHKNQKLNEIGDGSEKGGKHVATPNSNSANTSQGTQLDMGPSTPLPDKKLLLFILDRLQKKDTYGVFAEPVDPEELPDYHEVVEHPMDFGTVRRNLTGGAYASLEQFEKDVFLICSNAMQYNSRETIYFRQARDIQEMAKKHFKDLRQESDDNEPEHKIVRRGRPPTKNLKKQIPRPHLERFGSQFSSDEMLATKADNTNWSSEAYSGQLVDQKSERSAEIRDSVQQSSWMKRDKKQFVFDESRRNTYMQTHISSGAREPSVLTTFDGHRKQLMAVGLHTEYGYARSLARFGANLGPNAWEVLSEKIEKSLPAGVKFGPGWVGDFEEIQLKSTSIPSTSSTLPPPSSLSRPSSQPENSCATPTSMEIKSEKSSHISEGNKLVASTHSTGINGKPSNPSVSSAPTSSPINGNGITMIRPQPQIHHPSMNGFTAPRTGLHSQPHWQHVSLQKNKGTIPPDLNIRFQSPGSPTVSRADSMQPDLALQL